MYLFNSQGDYPMKINKLIQYPNQEDMQALRERNEERALVARQQLGELWSCHPKNAPKNNGHKNVLQH